ncbi:MAG: NAD-dependent epimerase/dehydratase family protein [Synechococcus sp.]
MTGHKGYIGTVLVPMLKARGHEVIGYDSDLYRDSTFGEGLVEVPEIIKDIREVETKDLEGVEAVLHLAGLSNDPLGNLNPKLTYEINHKASVRLAELSKKVGVSRFIFSSSCSNYGAGGTSWLTEQSEFNPVTPYGISKVKVEQDVSQLADDNFSPTFLRNATAYGVSPRLRFDLVLNNLVAWAFTTGRVFIKSDGTPWRPIVHIEDISRAFVAVMEAPREMVHNEAFNVGRNEDNYQVRDIADIVKETVPGCRIEYAEGAEPDTRCYRVDCSYIGKQLKDFQPQWDARKGAKQLYQAYQKVGLTLEEFEGPKYQRIAHIRKLIAEGALDEELRFSTTILESVN